jgi:hypothetical protein
VRLGYQTINEVGPKVECRNIHVINYKQRTYEEYHSRKIFYFAQPLLAAIFAARFASSISLSWSSQESCAPAENLPIASCSRDIAWSSVAPRRQTGPNVLEVVVAELLIVAVAVQTSQTPRGRVLAWIDIFAGRFPGRVRPASNLTGASLLEFLNRLAVPGPSFGILLRAWI